MPRPVRTLDDRVYNTLERIFANGERVSEDMVEFQGIDLEVAQELWENYQMERHEQEIDGGFYDFLDPPIPPFMREDKKDESLKIIAEQYIDKDLNCI